jgi:hypothetical protein
MCWHLSHKQLAQGSPCNNHYLERFSWKACPAVRLHTDTDLQYRSAKTVCMTVY